MELCSLSSDLFPMHKNTDIYYYCDDETSVRPLGKVSCKYKNFVFKGFMCPTGSISWLIT